MNCADFRPAAFRSSGHEPGPGWGERRKWGKAGHPL